MKRLVLMAFILLRLCLILFGQTGRSQLISFDFVDQQIREILYAFSTYAGVSIIGDDTVTGTSSFQYNGTDFEQAFDSFLLTSRLFAEKTPDLWIVSRVRVMVNQNDRIILDSLDATASQLVDKLTRKTSSTILQDILPSSRISLHLETASPLEAVELFMKPFSDYTVEAAGSYIRIKKTPVEQFSPMPAGRTGLIDIRGYDDTYEINIESARLSDVLDRFFREANREYLSFIRPDQMIERTRFSGRKFSEALSIILEQGGGEYKEMGSLFYVFPLQQAEIIASLKNEGKSWKPFEIRHLPASELLPLLQLRFSNLQIITLSGANKFLVLVNRETENHVSDFISGIDTPRRSEAIRLKYIKTEDLYRSLPPATRREDLIDAGDGNTFFYLGSEERKNLFLKDLEHIDRPQPRIRFDLFIIQVQDSTSLNWNAQAEARFVRPGDRTMVTGQLGNLLNLNFDVITVFGYQFAAKLNAAIAENQASVFADTTLFGLSGQEIKFQNTSTYRYRDSNIDPDTGKPIYSGITREIISGLVLDIKGWVSGDGMVTTTVAASVSKRGAEISSSAGNPPPTSEKVLTTQVRARSGETVVLSGLRQNDSTIIEQRAPFISRIPFLGWLFKSKNNSAENTQMIIYLVPHVDLANDEYAIDGLKTASIYTRFVEPYEGRR
ncbi:MAG: type II and III secretion system protein [Treponema sp.]|jgi:type II secretory pathway component GspD/PulD (secretin)|nr:type II and III secretion system protein [Treponema sp.]